VSVLGVLGGVALVLAMVSMLISRRRGDRFQYQLLLVVGLLVLGLSIAGVATDGRSAWEWIGVVLGAGVVGMAAFFLRRSAHRH
jgi:protein-S-isoprenylcysteine O-methyltransferase Ste14